MFCSTGKLLAAKQIKETVERIEKLDKEIDGDTSLLAPNIEIWFSHTSRESRQRFWRRSPIRRA